MRNTFGDPLVPGRSWPAPWQPYQPIVASDASLPLSMTRQRAFVMACHEKDPLPCHAERQRSIWFHQAGGVAHLGFFAALRMTCPGHFLIACRKKSPLPCHAERERSIWSHQAGGVAHLGFFAALRMTCPGHFLMACHGVGEAGIRRREILRRCYIALPAERGNRGRGPDRCRRSHWGLLRHRGPPPCCD